MCIYHRNGKTWRKGVGFIMEPVLKNSQKQSEGIGVKWFIKLPARVGRGARRPGRRGLFFSGGDLRGSAVRRRARPVAPGKVSSVRGRVSTDRRLPSVSVPSRAVPSQCTFARPPHRPQEGVRKAKNHIMLPKKNKQKKNL